MPGTRPGMTVEFDETMREMRQRPAATDWQP
jgi:hypothetical protein